MPNKPYKMPAGLPPPDVSASGHLGPYPVWARLISEQQTPLFSTNS